MLHLKMFDPWKRGFRCLETIIFWVPMLDCGGLLEKTEIRSKNKNTITIQETNISHLGKKSSSASKVPLKGLYLTSRRRVKHNQVTNKSLVDSVWCIPESSYCKRRCIKVWHVGLLKLTFQDELWSKYKYMYDDHKNHMFNDYLKILSKCARFVRPELSVHDAKTLCLKNWQQALKHLYLQVVVKYIMKCRIGSDRIVSICYMRTVKADTHFICAERIQKPQNQCAAASALTISKQQNIITF